MDLGSENLGLKSCGGPLRTWAHAPRSDWRSRARQWALAGGVMAALLFVGCGDKFTSCEPGDPCASGGRSEGGETGTGAGATTGGRSAAGGGEARGGRNDGAGGDEKGGSDGVGGEYEKGGSGSGVAGGEAGAGSATTGGVGTGTAGSGAEGGTASGGAAGAGGASDGGAGGDGNSGTGGLSCDPAGSPASLPCLVNDAAAVFVSPDGKDVNAGTRSAPVATLAQALKLAGTTRFVIACAGEFSENVAPSAGARIYGGFDCWGGGNWRYLPGEPTVVRPARGYPLLVKDVTASIVIEDVEFAANASTFAVGSESSVAAFFVNARAVTLRRVTLRAHVGVSGQPPPYDPADFPDPELARGNDGLMGGAAKKCVCRDGSTTQGGAGGQIGRSGQPGLPQYDHNPFAGLGGDAAADCFGSGRGTDGAPALAEIPPKAASALTLGSLSASGWTPGNGSPGKDGKPGQGGGGGRGSPEAPGGSGGCGGCGGRGAAGGGGGGGSIALMSLNSRVTLTECKLVTRDAGSGDPGIHRFPDPMPGAPGLGGGETEPSCDGGVGGMGSPGGEGGEGAGGLSVGILFSGIAPTRDANTSFTLGKAGFGSPMGIAAAQLSADDL